MKKYRLRLIILLILLAMSTGMMICSPGYLIYSTDYKKADAIILLLGPDFKARQKEANELISQGMADHLIIPAYNRTYGIYEKGQGRYLLPDLNAPEYGGGDLSYPRFYEDTHIEIIKAKRVMTGYGLESAIFVSSPYHMRRIKLIAGKLFDLKKGEFYFVPTKYERAPVRLRELSSSNWRSLRREYSKIIWFCIYSVWPVNVH